MVGGIPWLPGGGSAAADLHHRRGELRRARESRGARGDGPMTDYKYVSYEELDGGEIVRVLLNRPKTRNAQNRGLLVDLDDALMRAEEDDKVRVVILGGVGPMFSSGHDMGSKEAGAEHAPGPDPHR